MTGKNYTIDKEQHIFSSLNFKLIVQEHDADGKSFRVVTIDFDEIVKTEFPGAVPKYLQVYRASSRDVQAFLNEQFAGVRVGKFEISVLNSTEKKDLRRLTALDEVLVLIFFGMRYRLTVSKERAKFYRLLITAGLEQHIQISPMNYVSQLLEVNIRTLEQDVANAK